MSTLLSAATQVTMLSYAFAMLIALWRALKGPSAQDRIVAVDFMTVTAVLLMLVVGIRYGSNTYFEPALLLAIFSFVSSAAGAKFLLRGEVIE